MYVKYMSNFSINQKAFRSLARRDKIISFKSMHYNDICTL